MKTEIEYNNGFTAYSAELTGVYGRGKTEAEAIRKLIDDTYDYCNWSEEKLPKDMKIAVTNRYKTELDVSDADGDILLESEKGVLTEKEYEKAKQLCIQSAFSVKVLYDSIPDVDIIDKNKYNVKTFYGLKPATPKEMFNHITSVIIDYYAWIFKIDTEKEGIISAVCGIFDKLEERGDYLNNEIFVYENEQWNTKKLLRRIIWHNRIHAKAMYKLAKSYFGDKITNSFQFDI